MSPEPHQQWVTAFWGWAVDKYHRGLMEFLWQMPKLSWVQKACVVLSLLKSARPQPRGLCFGSGLQAGFRASASFPLPICLPAKGNLRMFLQVWPDSCSSCTSVLLAFIFASLYKLVSDAGLMSLLHAVIRVFRNSFEGLGAWGWCARGQRNV